MACPGSYFLSIERRFKYYANCEISISWWRLLQIAKHIDYFILWGRSDKGTRQEVSSVIAGAASSSVRPMVVIGKWLTGHVFICRHYIHVMSLCTMHRSGVQTDTGVSAFPM